MNAGKRRKAENRRKDMDNRDIEHLHRNLFGHPDGEKWNAGGSLAQPSFLKQVKSRGVAHTEPFPGCVERGRTRTGLS